MYDTDRWLRIHGGQAGLLYACSCALENYGTPDDEGWGELNACIAESMCDIGIQVPDSAEDMVAFLHGEGSGAVEFEASLPESCRARLAAFRAAFRATAASYATFEKVIEGGGN